MVPAVSFIRKYAPGFNASVAAVKPVAATDSEDAATTVACAPTVSDEAAEDVPFPPAEAVNTGVVRCEVAPAEGASRMSVCTAVPDVPAVFVLK